MNKQIEKTHNFANEITNKIHSGELQMKPKVYFVLGSFLSSLGVIVFSVLGTFFVNMIIHRLRIGRVVPMIREVPFNAKFMFLLRVFPWEYLLLSIGFVILGLYLLRKFDISYKKSYTFLVILFLVTVTLTAVGMDKMGFNERAKRVKHFKKVYGQHEEMQKPPFVKGEFHRRPHHQPGFERKNLPRMYK